MMQALYVRFHEEARSDPELEKRGQEEFESSRMAIRRIKNYGIGSGKNR